MAAKETKTRASASRKRSAVPTHDDDEVSKVCRRRVDSHDGAPTTAPIAVSAAEFVAERDRMLCDTAGLFSVRGLVYAYCGGATLAEAAALAPLVGSRDSLRAFAAVVVEGALRAAVGAELWPEFKAELARAGVGVFGSRPCHALAGVAVGGREAQRARTTVNTTHGYKVHHTADTATAAAAAAAAAAADTNGSSSSFETPVGTALPVTPVGLSSSRAEPCDVASDMDVYAVCSDQDDAEYVSLMEFAAARGVEPCAFVCLRQRTRLGCWLARHIDGCRGDTAALHALAKGYGAFGLFHTAMFVGKPAFVPYASELEGQFLSEASRAAVGGCADWVDRCAWSALPAAAALSCDIQLMLLPPPKYAPEGDVETGGDEDDEEEGKGEGRQGLRAPDEDERVRTKDPTTFRAWLSAPAASRERVRSWVWRTFDLAICTVGYMPVGSAAGVPSDDDDGAVSFGAPGEELALVQDLVGRRLRPRFTHSYFRTAGRVLRYRERGWRVDPIDTTAWARRALALSSPSAAARDAGDGAIPERNPQLIDGCLAFARADTMHAESCREKPRLATRDDADDDDDAMCPLTLILGLTHWHSSPNLKPALCYIEPHALDATLPPSAFALVLANPSHYVTYTY